MNRPYLWAAFSASLLVLGSPALGEAAKAAPKVTFEIRLAEKESAEGLEEMHAPQTKEKIEVPQGAGGWGGEGSAFQQLPAEQFGRFRVPRRGQKVLGLGEQAALQALGLALAGALHAQAAHLLPVLARFFPRIVAGVPRLSRKPTQ